MMMMGSAGNESSPSRERHDILDGPTVRQDETPVRLQRRARMLKTRGKGPSQDDIDGWNVEWDDLQLFVSLRARCTNREAQLALKDTNGDIWRALDVIASKRKNNGLMGDDGLLGVALSQYTNPSNGEELPTDLYRNEDEARASYKSRVMLCHWSRLQIVNAANRPLD